MEDGRRQREKEGGGREGGAGEGGTRERGREKEGERKRGKEKEGVYYMLNRGGILYKDNILDSHTKSTGTARETKELNIFSKKIHSPK